MQTAMQAHRCFGLAEERLLETSPVFVEVLGWLALEASANELINTSVSKTNQGIGN